MVSQPAGRRARLATVQATLIAMGLVAALSGQPAYASHGGGGDIRTSGSCGAAAHWKLKAKRDDGRIEAEGEIDSNHAGQRWQWTFKHNGSVSAHGAKRTSGPSGSFEVERRMSDLAGADRFTFRATHGSTVCRGTISV